MAETADKTVSMLLGGLKRAFKDYRSSAVLVIGAWLIVPLYAFIVLWPAVLQATDQVISTDPLTEAVRELIDQGNKNADNEAGVPPNSGSSAAANAIDETQAMLDAAATTLDEAIETPATADTQAVQAALAEIETSLASADDSVEMVEENLDAVAVPATTDTADDAQNALDDATVALEAINLTAESTIDDQDVERLEELQGKLKQVVNEVESLEDDVASTQARTDEIVISTDPNTPPSSAEIGAAVTVISRVDTPPHGFGVVKLHPFKSDRLSFEVSSEMLFLYTALVAGIFGGGLRSLVKFARNEGEDVVRLRGAVGGGMAVVIYFLIRGGLLQVGSDGANFNPYTIVAISTLTGMFAIELFTQLQGVATKAIWKADGSSDSQDEPDPDQVTQPPG